MNTRFSITIQFSLLFLLTIFEKSYANEELSDKNSMEQTAQITYTSEQEYLFDIFNTRRSVRKFKPDPIPEEHILKMMEIAHTAPTAGNQQPWKFLVIQDREKISQLKKECINSSLNQAKQRGITDQEKLNTMRERMEKSYGGYLSAPVVVVVVTDSKSKYPGYNEKDGTLAAGYLLIAARALGYGTVFTTDSFPDELVKNVFQIPENFNQICLIPIGVPETWPQSPEKKLITELVVWEEFVEGINYKLPVERRAIKLEGKVLQQYVGKYDYNSQLTINISLENGQLFMESLGQQKVEIFPESVNKFFLKAADAQITFIKNEKGKVTELIAHQAGQDFRAKKIK